MSAPLKNERQEMYARHRAQGMPPAKAAVAAGFAAGSGTYSKLEKDPEVLERIEHLKTALEEEKAQRRAASAAAAQAVGEAVGYTRAWVMQQLAENAARATQDGEYKAANEALKLIGDELGMFEGGSAGEDDTGSVPKTFDMGTLEALKAGHASLNQKESNEAGEIDPAERAKVAAQIIEGNKPRNAVKRSDRTLNTGSETDVALEDEPGEAPEPGEDSEPGDDFDEDA